MIVPRPYQLRALNDLRAAYATGARAPVLVAPTGSGKTCIAALVIGAALERGNRCAFYAGRRELVRQTVEKLAEAGITDVRVIQAQRDEGRPDAPVVVGSIQTMTQPRWLESLPDVDLAILDECHHGSASTWSRVLTRHAGARRLGLTATPERGDGRPLHLFDRVVLGPTVSELVQLGCLVPCQIWAPHAVLATGQIARDPVAEYSTRTPGERAVVFCSSVERAEELAGRFAAAGVASEHVDGVRMTSRRRDDVLARWRAGTLRVVTNVDVLTEGFDLPELGVAIVEVQPQHTGRWLQMIGRVLRPAPGKTRAQVIDLTGAVWLHGPPDLDRQYSLDGTRPAISGAVLDQIRQCRECGSVFRIGPSTCPCCGAELAIDPRPAPRVTGDTLVDAATAGAPPARKSEHFVLVKAEWARACWICKQLIRKGEQMRYGVVGRKATHRGCRA